MKGTSTNMSPDGLFNQNQLITNLNLRLGTKVFSVRLLLPEFCQQQHLRSQFLPFQFL